MSSVEIHVPLSPTPLFLNRLHYLAASLQVYGGRYAESRIVATIGADEEPYDLAAQLPWTRHYPISFRWVDRETFRRHSFFATRLDRFTCDIDADTVLMLDADVVLVGPIDELVDTALRTQSYCAIPAIVSPVGGPRSFTWEALYEAADLGPVEYVCEHVGWRAGQVDEEHRFSPPYFNHAVQAMPADLVRTIGAQVYEILPVVEPLDTRFRAQLTIAVALRRNAIPWTQVPLRFNFQNDAAIARAYPGELADVRIFHYRYPAQLDKDIDFESPEAVAALFERTDLDEVNTAFVTRLRPIHAHAIGA